MKPNLKVKKVCTRCGELIPTISGHPTCTRCRAEYRGCIFDPASLIPYFVEYWKGA